MRNSGAIRQKLKQVKYRYLKKLLAAKLARRPTNCTHNRTIDLPDHEPGLNICGLQLDDGSWNGGVCDEAHAGLQRASRCPHFLECHSKDALRDDFNRFFETANYGEIAYLYPMAAALIWVLEGDEGGDDVSEEVLPDEPLSETPQAPDQETLDKFSEEGDYTGVSETQVALEGLSETVRGLLRRVAELEQSVRDQGEHTKREFSDVSQRQGDLSVSLGNRVGELGSRLNAKPLAKPVGWFDRLLGRV